MNELSKIKEEALVLFAESDIDAVYKFLIDSLKDVNTRLHSEVFALKVVRNLGLNHKEKGLITTEEFTVHQNRSAHSLKIIIENLDKPFEDIYAKKDAFEKIYNPSQVSYSYFLQIIFFVQILILIGIGILIYLNL